MGGRGRGTFKGCRLSGPSFSELSYQIWYAYQFSLKSDHFGGALVGHFLGDVIRDEMLKNTRWRRPLQRLLMGPCPKHRHLLY